MKAYEKAIELAPEAQKHAQDSAEKMAVPDWAAARPKQEEALRVLKEIEQQFPKPPNQDQKSKQDQQSQQQQNKQDQNKGSDPKQQDQQPQNKNDESKGQDKKDASREQAESMLRQVREREREYRDRQKRQAILGGIKVDKDW
jgi:hypothetical protein